MEGRDVRYRPKADIEAQLSATETSTYRQGPIFIGTGLTNCLF
jgi:hypothetical protein